MSKIDEIALKHILSGKYLDSQMYDVNSVKNAMIEYAEFYAKKCLEIAAENARIDRDYSGDLHETETALCFGDGSDALGIYIYRINENSILNIKLPEHE